MEFVLAVLVFVVVDIHGLLNLALVLKANTPSPKGVGHISYSIYWSTNTTNLHNME